MVSQAKNRSPPRNGGIIRGRQLHLGVPDLDTGLAGHVHRPAEYQRDPVARGGEPQDLLGLIRLGVPDVRQDRAVPVLVADLDDRPARRVPGRVDDPAAHHVRASGGHGDVPAGERTIVILVDEGDAIMSGRIPADRLHIDLHVRLSAGGHAPRVREQIHPQDFLGGHATTPRPWASSSAAVASCRPRTMASAGRRHRTWP